MNCEKCQNHGSCPIEAVISEEHRMIVCHSFAEVDENVESVENHDSIERDDVNHPSHYETGEYECIEVMSEIFGRDAVKSFCLCNAFKYLWRCKHKHKTPTKCLEKSRWYTNKYLELDALPKTNEDLVREASTDILASILMCPYGDDTDMCITNKGGTLNCKECIKRWLTGDGTELLDSLLKSEVDAE